MTYVIAEPCIDVMHKACIEECPVDCIYEGQRTLYIHPDECVDCGACEPICPVEAIFYEDDLPQEWAKYTSINALFFDDSDHPAGRPRRGPLHGITQQSPSTHNRNSVDAHPAVSLALSW